MKNKVALWSLDGRGSLELSEPTLNARNYFRCTATLTVEGEPASVELEMITPYRSMWVEYFADLAGQIDGWKGRKVWDSEFAELRLACANDGDGPVEVDVLLRWPPTYEHERRGTLRVKREDIVRVRDELPEFLRLPAALL